MKLTTEASKPWIMAALLGAPLAGCTGDRANLTASFGGSVAGRRGEIQVLFINNTPWRAVFTVGTYDQTDTGDQPDFSQFGNDTEGGLVLEGGESSPIGSLDCARVFSIGGPRLLALIEENLPDAELLPEAGIEGVEFFTINTDGEADPAREGTAPPFEALLGVDFPCNALLIVRFEEDATGSFRVDFELIPSESER